MSKKVLPEGHVLSMYTIYFNPRDYPGRFVMREWFIVKGSREPMPAPLPSAVCDTLEEARRALPPGVVWMGRNPEDESQIVEVWV